MTYREKLRDRRWQEKSAKIKERDGWKCQNPACISSPTSQLQVHHKIYWSGKDPWEYHDNDLITLCFKCHEIEEDKWQLERGLKQALDHAGFLASDQVALTAMLYNPKYSKYLLKITRDFQNA